MVKDKDDDVYRRNDMNQKRGNEKFDYISLEE